MDGSGIGFDRGNYKMFERLVAQQTLRAAFGSVARGGGMPGPDGEGIDAFAADLEANVMALRRALVDGSWAPAPALRLHRRADPGRPLVVPTIRDRVIQRALADLLGPRVEQRLHDAAHAYRPRRSPWTAVGALREAIERWPSAWVARADVARFFDRIDRGRLQVELARVVADTRILELVRKLLGAGVLDGPRVVDSDLGIAQGSPLSPLLSNLYLAPFDGALAAKEGLALVRYSDDFCLVGADERAVREGLARAEAELARLALDLRPDKTLVLPADHGFEFVGFAVGAGSVAPPMRAIAALHDRLKGADPAAAHRAWIGFAGFYGHCDGWGPAVVERLAAEGHLEASLAAQRLCATDLDLPTDDAGSPEHRARERAAAAAFVASQPAEFFERFVELFSAREGCYAVEEIDGKGQRRFVRRGEPLTAGHARRHLAGAATVGVFVFRADGLVRWACLDLDAQRSPLAGDGPIASDAIARCHDDAVALAAALRKLGAAPLIEDSGHKGRHVWVRFGRPVAPRAALRLLFAAEDLAGPPPDGVRRERFPDRDGLRSGKDGPLVKLPLGIHGKSGRRCLVVGDDGTAASDQGRAVLDWAATDAAVLDALGQPATAPHLAHHDSAPDAGASLRRAETAEPAPRAVVDSARFPLAARTVAGCAVIALLVRKVEATGYLDHRERLLVAMTLVHLGREGPDAVDAIMAATHNYDRGITARWIKGTPPSPISCGRIRETYPALTRGVVCDCTFRIPQRGYPTPLLHAMKPSQVEGFGSTSRGGRAPPPRPGHCTKEAASDPPPDAPAAALEAARPPPVAGPSGPAPPQTGDPALAALRRWQAAGRELKEARAAVDALFAGADRIPCALGTLVRAVGDDGRVRYTVEIDGEP